MIDIFLSRRRRMFFWNIDNDLHVTLEEVFIVKIAKLKKPEMKDNISNLCMKCDLFVVIQRYFYKWSRNVVKSTEKYL